MGRYHSKRAELRKLGLRAKRVGQEARFNRIKEHHDAQIKAGKMPAPKEKKPWQDEKIDHLNRMHGRLANLPKQKPTRVPRWWIKEMKAQHKWLGKFVTNEFGKPRSVTLFTDSGMIVKQLAAKHGFDVSWAWLYENNAPSISAAMGRRAAA